MNFKKGFTLIEILLVVGIVAVIFSFSAPYGLRFYRSQLIEEARSNVIEALRRARHYAILQKNDSAWGVKIDTENSKYILFQGDSYDSRVDIYDEVYDLLTEAVVSGDWTEVVFSKMTGLPNDTGTTTLSFNSLNRGILIEETGTIFTADIAPVAEVGGICTDFTYSDWSACSAGGQTRTILTQSPDGCADGTPDILEQSCITTVGLISYWPLDGNANDAVGSNNGTVVNAQLTTGLTGGANTAYSFDGSGDYINMGANFDQYFDLGDTVTICSWAQSSDWTTDYSVVGTTGTYASGIVVFGTYQEKIYLYSNYPSVLPFGATNLVDGTWNHLCWDMTMGSSLKMYLNGELDYSGSFTKYPTSNIGNLLVGAWRYSVNNQYYSINGKIDQVRFYNRSLSADEIRSIYNVEAP